MIWASPTASRNFPSASRRRLSHESSLIGRVARSTFLTVFIPASSTIGRSCSRASSSGSCTEKTAGECDLDHDLPFAVDAARLDESRRARAMGAVDHDVADREVQDLTT